MSSRFLGDAHRDLFNSQRVLLDSQVLDFVANTRSKGKSIVFTRGVFDLLHSGHIRALNAAKERGDVLIVGLDSDCVVKKLKGEHRPINTQEDRLSVISSLKAVDFAFILPELKLELYTAAEYSKHNTELYRQLNPDLIVCCGSSSEFSGRVAKSAENANIKFINISDAYQDSYSTTNLIEQIKTLPQSEKTCRI